MWLYWLYRSLKGLQKYPSKKKKNVIFRSICGFLGPETMSPKLCRAQVALLQNSAGHRLRGPKLCGAQIERSKTLRGKFAFNICPAEFWTPQPLPCGFLDPSTCAPRSFGAMQPVPRGVLEQCNLCPAEFWSNAICAPRNFGDIISGTNIITKII